MATDTQIDSPGYAPAAVQTEEQRESRVARAPKTAVSSAEILKVGLRGVPNMPFGGPSYIEPSKHSVLVEPVAAFIHEVEHLYGMSVSPTETAKDNILDLLNSTNFYASLVAALSSFNPTPNKNAVLTTTA